MTTVQHTETGTAPSAAPTRGGKHGPGWTPLLLRPDWLPPLTMGNGGSSPPPSPRRAAPSIWWSDPYRDRAAERRYALSPDPRRRSVHRPGLSSYAASRRPLGPDAASAGVRMLSWHSDWYG